MVYLKSINNKKNDNLKVDKPSKISIIEIEENQCTIEHYEKK